jgi:hypothetical protein
MNFYIVLTTVAVYWISFVSVTDTLHYINEKNIYIESMVTQKVSCIIYKDNKKGNRIFICSSMFTKQKSVYID